MAQQTAVEWLALRYHHRQGYLSQEDIAEAKEMEKEQIIDAHYKGGCYFHEARDCRGSKVPYGNDAEDYYNETYGNDTQGKI